MEAGMTIRINEEAKQAYIQNCGKGWGKTEIASEALILGFEVMRNAEKHAEAAKIEAQREVLKQLVNKGTA